MIPDAIRKFFLFHRHAYRLVFNRNNVAAQYVLADLIEFCDANKTTFRKPNELELARNEGRRQVYLRIQRALNLTPEEQYALVRNKTELTQ